VRRCLIGTATSPKKVLSKAIGGCNQGGCDISTAKAKAPKRRAHLAPPAHTVHSIERVAYPVDGKPTPAWKVVVGNKPRGEWKVM
jgi:hypothetical protein